MTDQELVNLALSMQQHAYTPYSNFPVGAALEAEDGRIFTGCNVENAAYGDTICAERTALVKAVSEGARHFIKIAIAGSNDDFCWPCGTCRQVLSEFSPNLLVLAANRRGEWTTVCLSQLLPHSFNANNLT